jgi:hypothetical protein
VEFLPDSGHAVPSEIGGNNEQTIAPEPHTALQDPMGSRSTWLLNPPSTSSRHSHGRFVEFLVARNVVTRYASQVEEFRSKGDKDEDPRTKVSR